MSDWIQTTLGELVDIRKGVKVEVFDEQRADAAPYLGAGSLESGKSRQWASTRGAILAQGADVLMLWDGERSGLTGGGLEGVVASTVSRLRPRGIVDPAYLRRTLQAKFPWIQARRTGTGVPHVPKDLGNWLMIGHPESIAEQRRIAELLDVMDDQISATQEIVAKLDSIQIGLMRSLLGTRSVGASGRVRRGDVPVPPGWRSASLADVVGAPITYGIVQAGPHVPSGVPYVRTGDMSGDRLSIEGMLRTSRRIANDYARSTVHVGELVCAIRATVGKVLPVPPELDGANLTQGTARISPGRSIDPRFLYWEMCGERVQEQFALAIKGTTFFEITLAALRQVRVAMPELLAQREIAEVLDAQEALVQREHDLLTHLKGLKAGLMADLLMGRVRVPEGVAS